MVVWGNLEARRARRFCGVAQSVAYPGDRPHHIPAGTGGGEQSNSLCRYRNPVREPRRDYRADHVDSDRVCQFWRARFIRRRSGSCLPNSYRLGRSDPLFGDHRGRQIRGGTST